MSIRGINFGSVFSNRRLRFDSQKNNFETSFAGIKDIPNDVAIIKYGHPDIKRKPQNFEPPMLRYAIPSKPISLDDKTEIEKIFIQKLRDKFNPKIYARYAIPGHFND